MTSEESADDDEPQAVPAKRSKPNECEELPEPWECTNQWCKALNKGERLKCYKCSYFKDDEAKLRWELQGRHPSSKQGRRGGLKVKKKSGAASSTSEAMQAPSSSAAHSHSEADSTAAKAPAAKRRATTPGPAISEAERFLEPPKEDEMPTPPQWQQLSVRHQWPA